MDILFDFDDITIIPGRSLLNHEKKISDILKDDYKFPFFIRGNEKIKSVYSLINIETNIKNLKKSNKDTFYEYTYNEAYTLFIEHSEHFSKDLQCCVGIMLGNFNDKIIDSLSKIRSNFPKLKLIVGCVHSVDAYILLSTIGIDYIIVGSGFSYLTYVKYKTGVCIPDASLLKLIQDEDVHGFNTKIIAYPTFDRIQDLIKCFALGSDFIMVDEKIIKDKFNTDINLFINDLSKTLFDAIILSGFTKLSEFTSIKNYKFVPESHKRKYESYFNFKEQQKWEKAKAIIKE